MVPYNACVAPCCSTCATRPTAQHYVALQSTQLVSTHRLRGLRQKCGSPQKGDGRSPSLNGNRPSGLTLTLGPELGCEFDQNSHCKLDQSTYQVFDPSAAGLTASSHGDLLSRGTARAETKASARAAHLEPQSACSDSKARTGRPAGSSVSACRSDRPPSCCCCHNLNCAQSDL